MRMVPPRPFDVGLNSLERRCHVCDGRQSSAYPIAQASVQKQYSAVHKPQSFGRLRSDIDTLDISSGGGS